MNASDKKLLAEIEQAQKELLYIDYPWLEILDRRVVLLQKLIDLEAKKKPARPAHYTAPPRHGPISWPNRPAHLGSPLPGKKPNGPPYETKILKP